MTHPREININNNCSAARCRWLLLLCVLAAGQTAPAERLGTDFQGNSSPSRVAALQEQLELVEEQFAQQLGQLQALQRNVQAFEKTVDRAVSSTAKRRQTSDLWEQSALKAVNQIQQAADNTARLATLQGDRRFLSQSSSCRASSLSPTLSVSGVCRCTNGMLVQGHNVTHDLNLIQYAQSRLAADPVLDCSTLDAPKVVGSIVADSVYLDYARSVATHGNFAFVAAYNSGNIAIVNATDSATLAVVGNISVPLASYVDVSPDGKHLFTAGLWSNTLISVDVSDPTTPFRAGTLEGNPQTTFSFICDVIASPDGKYVYLSNYARGRLTVIDVSDPSNMTVALILPGVNAAWYMAVSNDGNFVYVLDRDRSGLTVVNTTDPRHAVVVGSIVNANETLEDPSDVIVSVDGNFVYASTYRNSGIVVINTTDPANPHVVGNITNDVDNLGGAYGVDVSPDGDYLYVASEYASYFAVVDVREPRSPNVVHSFRDSVNFRGAANVAVSSDGNVAFVVGPYGDSVAAVQWQNCSLV
eukprot:INCI19241.1.p1 GENE.INCI19241.1~~INCI19241.1.p1  ORF type:complete len:529 (+),score=102.99 INCI19241.1:257-1843(+)